MSETRERYYKLKSELEHLGNEGLRGEVDDYVNELEQQLTELKESRKQKQIIKLCNRLDKAEQQNKQIKEALRQCMTWLKKESKSMPNYDITQSVLWQSFDELLK